MSQNWTNDCFASGHVGQTDLTNMERNFICLRTLFSGAAQPASMAACHPWFDTTQHILKVRDDTDSTWYGLLHGDVNQKLWIYRDTAIAGWKVDAGISDRVLAIKGGATYTTGGTGAGTWTQPNHDHAVTSNVTVANHTALVLNNESAHTHGVGTFEGPSHTHNQGTLYACVHGYGVYDYYKRVGPAGVSWTCNYRRTHSTEALGHGEVVDYAVDVLGDTGADGTGAITGTSAAGSAHKHTFSTNISAHSVTNNAVTSVGSATVNTYRPTAAVGTLQYMDL